MLFELVEDMGGLKNALIEYVKFVGAVFQRHSISITLIVCKIGGIKLVICLASIGILNLC